MNEFIGKLNQLEKLDFTGKGEAFVESKYLTPLLECLGYDQHKDYEVIRHGDDGSSFKLNYPPVELGAIKVKHYNPDYIPTIRKKMFWIIEAKSAKDVSFPFDFKYIVQGLQYCIHPEIQAKYIVISNGLSTAVFDPMMAVFFNGNIYEPIYVFKNIEIVSKWDEIYKLLSVESLRNRIEDDLIKMYEKLSLSSLDKMYPHNLINKIGKNKNNLSHQIENHVAKLYIESMDKEYDEHQFYLSQLDYKTVYKDMDLPLGRGQTEAHHFIEKALIELSQINIYEMLILDFPSQSIFRKEQTYVALCRLYHKIEDLSLKQKILLFLNENRDNELNLLNQVECILLRITRKILMIKAYPAFREAISKFLENAPEMVKFINRPTSLKESFGIELFFHDYSFRILKKLPESDLIKARNDFEMFESNIESDFKEALKKLESGEKQIGGFEYYGYQRKHYAFNNIMKNNNLLERERHS